MLLLFPASCLLSSPLRHLALPCQVTQGNQIIKANKNKTSNIGLWMEHTEKRLSLSVSRF